MMTFLMNVPTSTSMTFLKHSSFKLDTAIDSQFYNQRVFGSDTGQQGGPGKNQEVNKAEAVVLAW